MTNMWCDILVNIIGTIIGGLMLAAILFLISEHIFTLHNLTGEWLVKTVTKTTAYNPYQDLEVNFKFHLLQKGQEIIGSGEKVSETSPTREAHKYPPDKRILSNINGYYQRNIFGTDKVFLNIIEEGRIRQSRSTYILIVKNKNLLLGTFTSTAADCIGQITLMRS